jgi:hypothetical protein
MGRIIERLGGRYITARRHVFAFLCCRDRGFADSPLEEAGFEISVPLKTEPPSWASIPA